MGNKNTKHEIQNSTIYQNDEKEDVKKENVSEKEEKLEKEGTSLLEGEIDEIKLKEYYLKYSKNKKKKKEQLNGLRKFIMQIYQYLEIPKESTKVKKFL